MARYTVEIYRVDGTVSVVGTTNADCPPKIRVMIGTQRTYLDLKPGETLVTRALPPDLGQHPRAVPVRRRG